MTMEIKQTTWKTIGKYEYRIVWNPSPSERGLPAISPSMGVKHSDSRAVLTHNEEVAVYAVFNVETILDTKIHIHQIERRHVNKTARFFEHPITHNL